MFWFCRGLVLVCLALALSNCSLLKKKEEGPPLSAEVLNRPAPTPEESREMLSTLGEDFIYGPGLGEVALHAGGVVAFPPYALVLLGNSALSLAGYETIGVSNVLPEKPGRIWKRTYQNVVSGPGRVSAAVAGEEFRSESTVKSRLREMVEGEVVSAETPQPGFLSVE